jgi:5-methylcytosine-specific restriction enzyme subunit McrC
MRLKPTPLPEGLPALRIEMSEWMSVGPSQNPSLKGFSLRPDMRVAQLAETLRGKLDLREGLDGLEITSTSFVGLVDLGPLRISVRPKLPNMPLAQLLRYAYGLRDVKVHGEAQSPTIRYGLHDLLISLLAEEVEELLHRGLSRRYVPLSADLENPRGRIVMNQIVRKGGVREAKLPCLYFERQTDWHLNRVLRSGLEIAAKMTEDRDLRFRLHRLSAMFYGVDFNAKLTADDVEWAQLSLTRLTAACQPALTLIGLLRNMLGLSFDSAQKPSRTPGFLFDMNIFFQRLLSRFLKDNLTDARIDDEQPFRDLFAYAPDANPRRRAAPAPRPDYAISRGNHLSGFLDAKYRDVWDKGLPAEWLYQLSIYALASPCNVSVLLYASMAATARDERIEVRQPVASPQGFSASVIIRPVPLKYLADILNPANSLSSRLARSRLANQLAVTTTQQLDLAAG